MPATSPPLATAQRPLALVTGASSGIGREIATMLAARGYDLVLVARREELLTALAASLQRDHGCRTDVVAVDLSKPEKRERLVRRIAPEKARLEVLINNAGFGTHGFFRETSLERELELIDVNCAAPVHLAKRILPWMLERKRGYIMNVASMSAFSPGPLMALYYASKSFVLSFSEALWEECRDTGVAVSALCPGPVRTEFQGVAGLASTARTSGAGPTPVQVVAAQGLDGLFAGKRVVVPGAANRRMRLAARFLPRTTILRWVRRVQEERRRATRLARGLPADS